MAYDLIRSIHHDRHPPAPALGTPGPPMRLGKITTATALIGPGKFLRWNPAVLLGNEVEGGAATIEVITAHQLTGVLVGTNAKQNDVVLFTFADYQWVTRGSGGTVNPCDCLATIPSNLFTGDGLGAITLHNTAGGWGGSAVAPGADVFIAGPPGGICTPDGTADIPVSYGLTSNCPSTWIFSIGFSYVLCDDDADPFSPRVMRLADPDVVPPNPPPSVLTVIKTIPWTCTFPLTFTMPTSMFIPGVIGGPYAISYPPGVGGTYTIAL